MSLVSDALKNTTSMMCLKVILRIFVEFWRQSSLAWHDFRPIFANGTRICTVGYCAAFHAKVPEFYSQVWPQSLFRLLTSGFTSIVEGAWKWSLAPISLNMIISIAFSFVCAWVKTFERMFLLVLFYLSCLVQTTRSKMRIKSYIVTLIPIINSFALYLKKSFWQVFVDM